MTKLHSLPTHKILRTLDNKGTPTIDPNCTNNNARYVNDKRIQTNSDRQHGMKMPMHHNFKQTLSIKCKWHHNFNQMFGHSTTIPHNQHFNQMPMVP